MGELGFYGFPVSLAAHHHPTYEPKTVTTGRYYQGELGRGRTRGAGKGREGSGIDGLCDLRPVTSP